MCWPSETTIRVCSNIERTEGRELKQYTPADFDRLIPAGFIVIKNKQILFHAAA